MPFNISLSSETTAQIDCRTEGDGRKKNTLGRSSVIDRDLDRYYTALRYARAELRKLFTGDEVAAIVDNLNGVWLSSPAEISIRGIALNVADGIALESLDQKWKVDGSALVQKLNSLTFTQSCALADAVEQFWMGDGSYHVTRDPRSALEERS